MPATERDLLYRAKFEEDVTQGLQKIQAEIVRTGTVAVDSSNRQSQSVTITAEMYARLQRQIEETNRRMRESASVVNSEKDEYSRLSEAISDSIFKLRAQAEALKDPVLQASLKKQAELRNEVNSLTKAAVKLGDEEEKGILSTNRARREAMVMMHELAMGNYKRLAGSAMVFGEYTDASWMEKLTGAITPMNIAIAGSAVVVAGFAVKMWNAAEASAEMVHKAELLGKIEGVSAQTMLGLQYMAEGTGVSIDVIGKAFGRFTEKLSSNSDAMVRMGVTSKDPIEAFGQLSEIIRTTADASERDAIAKEALGVGWQKLIPVLEQGRAGAENAIRAMHIPEETLKSYEKANAAQVSIDRSWLSIKLHAGEAAAGARAYFKEIEAGMLRTIEIEQEKHGGFFGILASFTHTGRMEALASQLNSGPDKNPAEWNPAEWNPAGGAKRIKSLSEDAEKDAAKNRNEIAKNSMSAALKEENDHYAQELKDFAGYARELGDAERAHQMRLKEIRERFSKKKQKTPEETFEERARKNRIALLGVDENTGDYRGFKAEDQSLREQRLKLQHKEALDNRKSELAAQQNAQKIQLGWEKAISDARRKEHEERMNEIRKEADLVQGFASRELSQAIQGKMTWKRLEADATAFLADQFAERTTKWIENQILESAFAKVDAAEQLAQTQATAAASAAAWSPAAISASISTLGGAAFTGQAAYFQALASGQIMATGMIPHARGGMVFGPSLANREEMMVPFQPGRIVPSYNSSTNTTHNNYGGNSIVVHIHGGDEKRILRTIRNATMDGRQSYR